MEQHDFAKELWGKLPDHNAEAHHLLVIDIGGGTSDFSLFEFRSDGRSPVPDIRRVAVSEHILLGGDNVDLALAHFVEPQILGDHGQLSSTQWDHLVAHCRDLKEKALSSAGEPDEAFQVSLPGRGSDLVTGLRSAQLTRAEIERVLLEGFFPECDANARPYRTQIALREWGLPYASDSAITRHLAAFLRDRPRADAVLLNGGSLNPQLLHQRICQQIGKWRGDFPPLLLKNVEPGFAVARGAAQFGRLVYHKAGRIAAGAAHAIFLEVHRKPATDIEQPSDPSLVCVLPQDAPPEEEFQIADASLALRTNWPVRFQAYHSRGQARSHAGDIVVWSEHEFHALPPLETIIKVADQSHTETSGTLPVRLKAKMNELGLLQVSCVSADRKIRQSWPLEFNLRPQELDKAASGSETISGAPVAAGPNVATDALEAARRRIASRFTGGLSKTDKLTAARLVKSLEQSLGISKSEWNAALVRALWPALETCMACRKKSVDHEEVWLALAGFLLRPGFGVVGDEVRLDSLWRLRETGLCFPGKQIRCQEYILWRRVAGGLTPARQERILTAELEKIHSPDPPAELIRLAGSLELLPEVTKAGLITHFIGVAADLAYEKKHCAPYLAALGLLLNRAPLYAGPEAVVSPDLVESAYAAFRGFDWTGPELSELKTLFLRAARVVGDRSLDLPKSLRNHIAHQLEKSGVDPLQTGKIREFAPVGRWDRVSLYGESLPPGLILSKS